MRSEICRISREAGRVMGCRGYFRVDLRERNGKLFVLEVNPNPDINTDSGFVKQSARRGLSYPEMVAGLVKASLDRRVSDEEKVLRKSKVHVDLAERTSAFSGPELSVLEEVLDDCLSKRDPGYWIEEIHDKGVLAVS